MDHFSKAIQCCMLLCLTIVAVDAQQHPESRLLSRSSRGLRLVIDSTHTQHWGTGRATVAQTWVPAKAFYDEKKAANKEAAEGDSAASEAAAAGGGGGGSEASAEAAKKPQQGAIAAVVGDKAAQVKTVTKDMIIQGTLTGTNKGLEMGTGAKP